MNSVLIVEDDKLLRQMLRDTLEIEDFLVLEASHGSRLLEILAQHKVDLILLDLRLPDGYGLDFFPEIRTHTNAPVIILSGDSEKESKLNGLNLGADDYIEKPFDSDILIAKILCNIRRSEDSKHQNNTLSKNILSLKPLTFGSWSFDREQFQIFNENGESGGLTVREFALLNILISNAGKAISRDALCDAVKDNSYKPTPRSIDIKITRIRKKIGESAQSPELISTIRGIGYMFNSKKINTA